MRSSDESSVVAIACGAGGSTCSNNAPETEIAHLLRPEPHEINLSRYNAWFRSIIRRNRFGSDGSDGLPMLIV
jgi:hypothetical protein